MSTFTLSARLDDLFEVVDFTAQDELDATVEAIDVILTRANHDGEPTALQRLWAYGAIELRNSLGDILHSMDAKEVPA